MLEPSRHMGGGPGVSEYIVGNPPNGYQKGNPDRWMLGPVAMIDRRRLGMKMFNAPPVNDPRFVSSKSNPKRVTFPVSWSGRLQSPRVERSQARENLPGASPMHWLEICGILDVSRDPAGRPPRIVDRLSYTSQLFDTRNNT